MSNLNLFHGVKGRDPNYAAINERQKKNFTAENAENTKEVIRELHELPPIPKAFGTGCQK